MIALDTNVLVRLLVNDHPEQTRRAKRLLEAQSVVILPTVLLESEWVLRGAYRLAPGAIAQAIDWYERGLDFAEALHLPFARDARL